MKKVLPLVVAASLLLSTVTSFATTNSDATSKFLEKKFNISDAAKEFKTLKIQIDEFGMKHVKLQQIVNGIPVYGGEFLVHYDANGSVYAYRGSYDVKVKEAKASAALTSKDAIEVAKAAVNYTAVAPTRMLQADKFNAALYLYDVNGEYIPVYVVTVNWLHENEFGNYKVFVDANTGGIVKQYDDTKYTATTGVGTGIRGDSKTIWLDYVSPYYTLKDLSRGAYTYIYDCNYGTSLPGSQTTSVVRSTSSSFTATTQRAAVDAEVYLAYIYDMYKGVLNRNGIDGNNALQKASVHYGVNCADAFWNGSQFVFGDGDGITPNLLAALDLVAHEYSHAVTDYLGGLDYYGESGSLSESFSDVMACATEYYKQNSRFDWLIGEDICAPGSALRSLANPPAYEQPDNYASRYIGTYDNGGVHTNSGIPNHAAYTMGTNSLIGVSGMAKIFYRANQYYYATNETFSWARQDTIQAATDLGLNTTVVSAAWDHVGVY